jgi:hypothetical protein
MDLVLILSQETATAEFEKRKLEREQLAESKTAKNRAKRDKKKVRDLVILYITLLTLLVGCAEEGRRKGGGRCLHCRNGRRAAQEAATGERHRTRLQAAWRGQR